MALVVLAADLLLKQRTGQDITLIGVYRFEHAGSK